MIEEYTIIVFVQMEWKLPVNQVYNKWKQYKHLNQCNENHSMLALEHYVFSKREMNRKTKDLLDSKNYVICFFLITISKPLYRIKTTIHKLICLLLHSSRLGKISISGFDYFRKKKKLDAFIKISSFFEIPSIDME